MRPVRRFLAWRRAVRMRDRCRRCGFVHSTSINDAQYMACVLDSYRRARADQQALENVVRVPKRLLDPTTSGSDR